MLRISVLVGTLVTILFGCRVAQSGCWPELRDIHNRLYALRNAGELNSAEATSYRSRLKLTLAQCPDDTPLFGDATAVFTIDRSELSLLDLAVIADDVRRINEYLPKMQAIQLSDEKVEELNYGRAYLELAAFFESPNAAAVLIENGFDANQSSIDGNTALHSASAQTAGGLVTIRTLIEYGADVNACNQNNVTPIIAARMNGDLRKAQCLVAAGARIPDAVEFVGFRVNDSAKEAVETVDKFLQGSNVSIPKSVSNVCAPPDEPLVK